MITKVEAVNSRGTVLSLPLMDTSGGFEVQNIQGLEPTKASIASTRLAGRDGSLKHGGSRDQRNIVLTLGFRPNWATQSVDILRSKVYEFFMTNTDVTLRFYKDDVYHSFILGTVESCEPSIFSRDPAVVISILCGDPAFTAPTDVVVSGTTSTSTNLISVTNPGNIRAEYTFRVTMSAAAMHSAILVVADNTGTYYRTEMTYTGGSLFAIGDILEISSVFGNRGMWRLRGSNRLSVLGYLGALYDRLDATLAPGSGNGFSMYSTAANPVSLTFRPKFGGL